MMEERPSNENSWWRPSLLVASLILFVVGWIFLIVNVPILLEGNFPGFRMDREAKTAVLTRHSVRPTNPWLQTIKFDTNSGELSWDSTADFESQFWEIGQRDKSKHQSALVDSRGIQLAPGNYRLLHPQGSGKPDRLFKFPAVPVQVNDRYAVQAIRGNIVIADFTEDEFVQVKTPVGGTNVVGEILPIDDFGGFLRFQNLPPSGNVIQPVQVQHFTIEDNRVATLNSTWVAIAFGFPPTYSIAQTGAQLVSINPVNSEIEFRSSIDGSLIESVALLDGMDLKVMSANLWPSYFRVEVAPDAPRFFDLRNRNWLPLVEGKNFSPLSQFDERFILFRGLGQDRLVCKVFDIKKQKVVATLDSTAFTDFIDDESILDMSFWSGLTFREIDVASGAVLKEWRPFWWVTILSTPLCVAWFIWSWSFNRFSQRQSVIRLWVGVAVVSMVPLILCIVRTRFVGDSANITRLPVDVAKATILGLLLVGSAWLVCSGRRLVPRLLPFLLAVAALAISVSFTFAGQLEYVVPNAIQALVPVSVFVVCFLVMRKLGFRLYAPNAPIAADSNFEAPSHSAKVGVITIRDMFVLTGVLAVLFAGLTPWLPGFRDVVSALLRVGSVPVEFSLVSFGPVIAWWLAMNRGWLRFAGDVFFTLAFAFLVASAACRFSGSSSLIGLMLGVYPPLGTFAASCFVASYWIALCFRWQGWRISKGGEVQVMDATA